MLFILPNMADCNRKITQEEKHKFHKKNEQLTQVTLISKLVSYTVGHNTFIILFGRPT